MSYLGPFKAVFDPVAQICAKQQLYGCMGNTIGCNQKKFQLKRPRGSKVMSKKLNIPPIYVVKWALFGPYYLPKVQMVAKMSYMEGYYRHS